MAPRSFAGLPLDRPLLMGILNVTPDSFSDGGLFQDAERAIAHGLKMAQEGADIIDVGGESTRPGAEPVSPDEEMERILPVVTALAADGLIVSIDTRHAAVMEAAMAVGARIINDVSALTHDPDALSVAAAHAASVILMHSQGEPATMQDKPHYDSAPREIYHWLEQRILACEAGGLSRERLCVDPGIGFGKNLTHNCQIIAALGLYQQLGVPVLLGASRKSFIAKLSRGEPADRRLAGSLAAALLGLDRGVQILRVHDVAETAQAVAVWQAIKHDKNHVTGDGP